MTTFLDGPAKCKTLLLRRTPMLLRVVEKGGEFDALDQECDKPEPGEKLHAYVIAEHRGYCHINKRGGGRGFYNMVSYRIVSEQPDQAVMADKESWSRWCFDNIHIVPPEFLRTQLP